MTNHSEQNRDKTPNKRSRVHRPYDVRPEEIIKIEQEAPLKKVIITDTVKITDYSLRRTDSSGRKTLFRQRSFEEVIRVGLSPALEDNVRRDHRQEKKITKKPNLN